jgi:hypothetical protein
MPQDRPLISDRSPTLETATRRWHDPDDTGDAQTVGTLGRLIELERDMIAALLAARNRLEQPTVRTLLDELLADHAGRVPVLERQIRELGGLPPEPAARASDLPRDASAIAVLTDERDVLRAVTEDHDALAGHYRSALEFAGHAPEARRLLELHADEMSAHRTRLAAIVAT